MVTLALALFTAACAAPRQQMHLPASLAKKFPLTAAIIWPEEKMRLEWQPPFGYSLSPVHSGNVLGQLLSERVSFPVVFVDEIPVVLLRSSL